MSRRHGGDGGGAKAEVLIEQREQLAGREPADLGCRQFNGQRKAVERMTYPGNRVAIIVDEVVVRPLGGEADQQLHAREFDGLGGRQRAARPRQAKRAKPHQMLGRGPERLAAGCQQPGR